MAGRYTRLFPEYRAQFTEHDLEALAHAMISPPELPSSGDRTDPEEDPDITAAYTYLGQFTDHDLTFDATSQLREALTDQQLNALMDLRTPRFDLDNLYGRGPDDQPYMYEMCEPDRIRMLLGDRLSGSPLDPDARDLPRGPNGRALIGDPRNDENRIVAQLHAIFLRFHNKVADYLGNEATFEDVRDQVRWHYQWMLVTDFLPQVINDDTYRRVFGDLNYPTPTLPELRNGLRLMPVEFSVAAFRFGHSMIRSEYQLNNETPRRLLFLLEDGDAPCTDDTDDLRGFRPIPRDWAIDWRLFIDLDPEHHGPEKPTPQKAYRIDTSLVNPLGDLPSQIVPCPPESLALRNLRRGAIFSLPTGQQVARALKEEPIPNDRLVIGKGTVEDLGKLPTLEDIVPGLADHAPLWTYILSEAQMKSWDRLKSGASPDSISIQLGPVGGRIVADVFAALLRGDPTSYLNQGAPFTPIPRFAPGGRFGLAELINAALGPTS